MYTVCMKRTNLVLDEKLLEEALFRSGERTYSGAVTRALEEFVKRGRALAAYDRLKARPGWWVGDLAEMRGDSPPRPARKRPQR